MEAANKFNPKKIASLANKNDMVLIEKQENEYLIMVDFNHCFILDDDQYQEFKEKYNSYKNVCTIPSLELYEHIVKIDKQWNYNDFKTEHLPSKVIADYNDIVKEGYQLKDYKECNIIIDNNIIYNGDQLGWIGIDKDILEYIPNKIGLHFYQSKIYIVNNNGIIGYIQSGDHKQFNKHMKALVTNVGQRNNQIDENIANDDKVINGVENVA